MTRLFADRMASVHRSFVRDILKVTEDPEVISFAGLLKDEAKLFYSVPNFQNPTGITYSKEKRRDVAAATLSS